MGKSVRLIRLKVWLGVREWNRTNIDCIIGNLIASFRSELVPQVMITSHTYIYIYMHTHKQLNMTPTTFPPTI